jgi:hypothetical protein
MTSTERSPWRVNAKGASSPAKMAAVPAAGIVAACSGLPKKPVPPYE